MDRNGHHEVRASSPSKSKRGNTFFEALFGLGVPPAAARLGEGHDANVKDMHYSVWQGIT